MSAAPAAAVPAWQQGLLLPSRVRPSRYDVSLAPDLERFTFQGHVRIALEVGGGAEEQSDIVLHSLELTYPLRDGKPDVELLSAEGAVLQRAERVELDDAGSQRARFVFPAPIAAGSYTFAAKFDGILNDQLAGFYRSAFRSARDGKEKFCAVTQFEATDCRRALPCVDEPAVKATFAVTLITEPSLQSISNMPVLRRETIFASAEEQGRDANMRGIVVPKGWIKHVYDESPVMSTYLLAFIVGEFDYVSAFVGPSPGVPGALRTELRIYTPEGQTHLGAFALDVATKCLQLYEQFFQIPYPLPKCDLIAVSDFASGAMENWGAITYRDTMLLIDPEQSSALVKQRCAKTIAHELAHMWFGNLCTMSWWNSLWLNEGFARYCESWAVDVLFPDWQVMEQFVSDVFGAAQTMDSLESSHPVEVDVSTPEEINEIFDPISYNKGASLIRMLLELIGPAAFQRGLQIYLRRFAYKNTRSDDLWDCFTEAVREGENAAQAQLDIHALMARWCTAIGYPVLAVTEGDAADAAALQAAQHGKCMCFKVSQAKYLQSGKGAAKTITAAVAGQGQGDALVSSAAGSDAPWSVPLSISAYSLDASRGVAISHRILDRLQGLVQVDLPSEGEEKKQMAVSFNHASSGFYRLFYAPPLFAALSTLIGQGALPVLDRLALLRDCYALSACGLGYDVSNLLDLILLFSGERNYTVLQFLGIVLSTLCSLHGQDAQVGPALQKMVAAIFLPRWNEIGWAPQAGQKEHHLTYLERSLLLSMLGNYAGEAGGASSLAEKSFSMLEASMTGGKAAQIHPDLRAPVYVLAIRARGQQARELLLAMYRAPDSSNEEKVRVLTALGTTRRFGFSSTEEADKENRADLERLLSWVLESGEVRTGDLLYVLSAIGQDSPLARGLCWAYMRSHWSSLIAKFKGAMFVLGRIFPAVLGEMDGQEDAKEFEEWFVAHPALGAERSVKQSAETVRARAERIQRERPVVTRWIAEHDKQL